MRRARPLLLVLASCLRMVAHAADCPLSQAPLAVSFSTIDAPVAERPASRARIAELDKQPTSKGYIDLGLTQANLQSELTAIFKIARTENGVCAVPVRADVRIGYSEMTVFLDKRYAKDSCEFAAIRRHEYRHVDTFHEVLATHLPDIRFALERAGRSGGFPVEAADAESAKAKALAQLDGALHAEIRTVYADMNRRQDALDTPASYAAVHASCRGW